MIEWLKKFLDSVPILILIGTGILLLGLAGGLKYDKFDLPLRGPIPQTVATAIGIVLLSVGVLEQRSRERIPKRETYDVKIQYPTPGAEVYKVDVVGTIKKSKLPEDYELRVFRLYPQNGGFVPIGEVTISDDGTWKAMQCNIGGEKGNDRGIGIYLVGSSGRALLNYFVLATAKHNELMSSAPSSTANKPLPPIKNPTSDMVPCAEVWVKRS
jgi:hypothetical protein